MLSRPDWLGIIVKKNEFVTFWPPGNGNFPNGLRRDKDHENPCNLRILMVVVPSQSVGKVAVFGPFKNEVWEEHRNIERATQKTCRESCENVELEVVGKLENGLLACAD